MQLDKNVHEMSILIGHLNFSMQFKLISNLLEINHTEVYDLETSDDI